MTPTQESPAPTSLYEVLQRETQHILDDRVTDTITELVVNCDCEVWRKSKLLHCTLPSINSSFIHLEIAPRHDQQQVHPVRLCLCACGHSPSSRAWKLRQESMSLVAPAIDLREEMDDTALLSRAAVAKAPAKAKFLIRTLPKDCNPTPVTAHHSVSSSNCGGAQLLSPSARMSPHHKTLHTSAADSEMHLPDNPFDDITEDKLQKLSGKQDLARVTFLQLAVDSGKQSVEVIGELLPSLQQLKLQNSTLHSFRDLGTSLHALQILWVMRSGINDLDGIGALTGLQELYLQYNDISDLSPLMLHEDIQVIDLEGNCVADIGQIEQLAFCAQLTTLNLEANPVCKIAHYRQIIANFLPQLTTLDDKLITDTERAKISDEEIDAAIKAHQEELGATSGSAPATVDDRLLIADGIKASSCYDSPCKLSRSSSTQRVTGVDPASEARNSDSGSSLTHGTNIVFAGNVTSSLRRHRSENESDAQFVALAQQLAVSGCGDHSDPSHDSASSSRCVSPLLIERPKTPARMSITDTLDRANELETQKHKSRDAILNELKAWQQEGAVSQLGATHVPPLHRDSSSPSSKRKAASRSKRATPTAAAQAERRPNTSAGVLRNGVSVKEAFVETRRDHESSNPTGGERRASRAKTPAALHHRSSFSASSAAALKSSRTVDILILDEGDKRRPCSPTKSSRGIFATGASKEHREWNFDALAPMLDLSTAESSWRNFPLEQQASASHQNDRVFQKTPRRLDSDDDEDGDSSSSDGEATTTSRLVARKPKLQSKTSQSTFFNVVESLHAIDKWRDDMDDDDKKIVRVDTYQQECFSPRTPTPAASNLALAHTSHSRQLGSTNQHETPPQQQDNSQQQQLGPANFESDERIVQFMKEKHKMVMETKTRDGFRRFFRGIEAERLERILQSVFPDQEKVRRRLQLMAGFYRHELEN